MQKYRNEQQQNYVSYAANFPPRSGTKIYVDRKFLDMTILSYEGHIPPLDHSMSKTGFIASASSQKGPHNGVRFAFSSNSNKEWAVDRVGVGSWIQISCPTPVRIWKIRLTGRKTRSNQPRMALELVQKKTKRLLIFTQITQHYNHTCKNSRSIL